MSRLVVVVPAGRGAAGRAVLLSDAGKARLGPFPIVATASRAAAIRNGNPERDWRKPFGSLPTGTYVVAGAIPPERPTRADPRDRRAGSLGALVLAPVGGNALEALRAGRTRFLLQGGAADARGRKRPTFGGLRHSDADLAALLRAINDANAAGDPLSSVVVAETAAPTWVAVAPLAAAAVPARPRGES